MSTPSSPDATIRWCERAVDELDEALMNALDRESERRRPPRPLVNREANQQDASTPIQADNKDNDNKAGIEANSTTTTTTEAKRLTRGQSSLARGGRTNFLPLSIQLNKPDTSKNQTAPSTGRRAREGSLEPFLPVKRRKLGFTWVCIYEYICMYV